MKATMFTFSFNATTRLYSSLWFRVKSTSVEWLARKLATDVQGPLENLSVRAARKSKFSFFRKILQFDIKYCDIHVWFRVTHLYRYGFS